MVGVMDENQTVVLGDLNGNVGAEALGYEEVHKGSGYSTHNAEAERILASGEAMNMIICHTAYKKKKVDL